MSYVNTPLINPEKVYLLPLHIKFEQISTKPWIKIVLGFRFYTKRFPRISDGKIKEVVFVGPQIRELIQDVKFEGQLSEVEKAA